MFLDNDDVLGLFEMKLSLLLRSFHEVFTRHRT